MLLFTSMFAAVTYMATALDSWFSWLFHIWSVILGGLVVWVGFLIARFCVRHTTPRNRGGRR